jgi:hypothetical protein
MDDTESDSADAPKPKSWKHLRKGPQLQESIDQVFDDPFPFEYENPDCNPFAFGGIDWCETFTPDADEIRWQERTREEEQRLLQMILEVNETTSTQASSKNEAAQSVSISSTSSS